MATTRGKVRVYVTAVPGDKVEVRETKTDTPVFKAPMDWNLVLTESEWNKCRDGLTIYKELKW